MTIQRYEDALNDEVRASGGKLPMVAILGEHDFDALRGELMTMFGLMLRIPSEVPDKHVYKGVTLFKSYSCKHGLLFGGGEA